MIIIDCPCFFVAFDGISKDQKTSIIEVGPNTTLISNADDKTLGLNTYFADTQQKVIDYLTDKSITIK